MGTRGTLKVYVDDELKICQYNQWDSYPTGQFAAICEFMSDKERRTELARRLKQTRFFTKEEAAVYDAFCESGKVDAKNRWLVERYGFLTNRDFGSDILWQVLCLQNDIYEHIEDEDGKTINYIKYRLPDWRLVFDEGGELEPQEGNYTIRLRTSCQRDDDTWLSTLKVDGFLLSGEYHGDERVFDENVIPTEEEIQAWEDADKWRNG